MFIISASAPVKKAEKTIAKVQTEEILPICWLYFLCHDGFDVVPPLAFSETPERDVDADGFTNATAKVVQCMIEIEEVRQDVHSPPPLRVASNKNPFETLQPFVWRLDG